MVGFSFQDTHHEALPFWPLAGLHQYRYRVMSRRKLPNYFRQPPRPWPTELDAVSPGHYYIVSYIDEETVVFAADEAEARVIGTNHFLPSKGREHLLAVTLAAKGDIPPRRKKRTTRLIGEFGAKP